MATYSWATATSGDWTTASLWSPAVTPNAATASAVIGVAGTYDVTLGFADAITLNALSLTSAGAEFFLLGAITMAGARTVNVSAGTLDLVGTVSGATLSFTGGVLNYDGGTLDGSTVLGPLDLSAPGASVTLSGGSQVTGAAGTGPGTIVLGETSSLYVAGTSTLDRATVTLCSSGRSAYGLSSYDALGSGVVLTLGTQLLVRDSMAADGTAGGVILAGGVAGDQVVNKGTIQAVTAGGLLSITGNSFTNQGTISVSNGDELAIGTSIFTNLTGGKLTGGTYVVTGASTLDIPNNKSLVTLNASLILDGVGATLQALQTASFTETPLESMLTAIGTAGTLSLLSARGYATTNAISNAGLIVLTGGAFSAGILTLAATGTLSGAGAVTSLVTGPGTVQSDSGLLRLAAGAAAGTKLVVNAGSTLELAAATAAGTVLDNGVLQLDGVGLTATLVAIAARATLLGSGVVTGPVTSTGLLLASGGTLSLTGTVTGAATLTAVAGSVLQLNQVAPVSASGVVTLSGVGAVIRFGTAPSFTLLEASLKTVAATGTLAVLAGRGYVTTNAVADSGLITLGGGAFSFGSLTIATTGRVFGNGTINAALANAGTIVADGGRLTLTGAVSGAGGLLVNAGGTLELVSAAAAGSVIDNGVLQLDGQILTATTSQIAAGAQLLGTGLVTNGVANAGTIDSTVGLLQLGAGATGAGALVVDWHSTLELMGNASAGAIVDSGVLKLDGFSLTATSLLVSGRLHGYGTVNVVVANSGTIQAYRSLMVLSKGATGTGTLQVNSDGTVELAAATTQGNLIGNGLLLLDGQTAKIGTSTLSATGIVRGSGSLTGRILDDGTIDAKGGLLVLAGTVSGSGALLVENAATLELTAAVSPAVTFAAGGIGRLILDAPASFTGGIKGLALGDTVTFSNETVSSAVISGTTLTVVGSAGTVQIQVAGALGGNRFAIQSDQHTITLVSGALALAQASFLPATTSVAVAPAAVPITATVTEALSQPLPLVAVAAVPTADPVGGGGTWLLVPPPQPVLFAHV